MYPTVGMATLSKCRREFLAGAQAPTSGRPSKVSIATQQYIARMVRNGSLNGTRGVQEYLRSINISMSLSGPKKLLKGMGLKV
jgi:transposase